MISCKLSLELSKQNFNASILQQFSPILTASVVGV
jgi:hypothetical protein